MIKQKTVNTLPILYFEAERRNAALCSLVREARAAVQVMSRREPLIAVWAGEWLTRVSALVDQETPK